MDTWFLDNLEKLVPIVIAILYFLGTSRAKKNAETEPETESDPEAADRARRIQEEIRRKILERQQKGNARTQREEPPELPATEAVQPLHPKFEKSSRKAIDVEIFPSARRSEPPPIPSGVSTMDYYEQQRKDADARLRKSREIKEQARLKDLGTAYELPVSGKRQKALNRRRHSELIDGLDDAHSLRRAIVMKEILDVPVALR